MGKLCQCCNQREAKIHFTELKDGKKTEMHLCDVCAQEKNMVLAFPSLLSTLVKGGASTPAGESEAVPAVCPRCGLRSSRGIRVRGVRSPGYLSRALFQAARRALEEAALLSVPRGTRGQGSLFRHAPDARDCSTWNMLGDHVVRTRTGRE